MITGELAPSRAVNESGLGQAFADITLFDTSVDGEVMLESDGSRISVRSYAREKKVDLK